MTKNRGSGNPVVMTYTLDLAIVVCYSVVSLFVICTVETQNVKWKVNWKFVEGSRRVVLVRSMTAYGRVEFSSTQFRRAFAKLRKGTISFAMSVSTSVHLYLCPHGKNSAPTGRSFMMFDIRIFSEDLSSKFKFY